MLNTVLHAITGIHKGQRAGGRSQRPKDDRDYAHKRKRQTQLK